MIAPRIKNYRERLREIKLLCQMIRDDEIESVNKKTGENHYPEIVVAAAFLAAGAAVVGAVDGKLKANNKSKGVGGKGE